MEMEPVPGYAFANWELGYGDVHLVPDLATLRVASWLDKTAFVVCDVKSEKTHDYVAVAPRSILRRQIDRGARRRASAAFAATELEHYLFRTSYRDAAAADYRNLEPAGWYLEDYHLLQGTRTESFHAAARRHLKLSGVPVETSKGEWGRGQHELNIRYAEALDMADRHVAVQAVPEGDRRGRRHERHLHGQVRGRRRGLELPHPFQPVARRQERVRRQIGQPSGTSSAAGSRTCPTSWCSMRRRSTRTSATSTPRGRRRGSPGATTTAPRASAWSAKAPSLRIECRIPGADCNPYLALAASLASGLDGIANRIEPPEAFVGDIYAAKNLPRVPYTLSQAVDAFERSEFAKRAFGNDVVEHYAHFYRTEAGGLRPRGHRLGTQAILRAHMRLKDKVALITGAGSGIGRQSALLFAKEGASVLAVDLNEQAAAETVGMLRQAGGRAVAFRADVSKARDCQQMVAAAEREFGRLNVLFNNAGIMHSKDDDAIGTDESVWDLTLDVNAKGVFLGCKYGIPALRHAGGGSVINTASFVARMGAATPQIAYTASKGAVLAMTRELAVIHARENIRVNALCPGPLKTELLMSFLDTEEKKQRRLVHLPMGRFGEAHEIAQAALWLASDESSYVTGTEFLVDGGLTAAYVTPE